jgi:ACS family hexuronate transporter-like MFS transporter
MKLNRRAWFQIFLVTLLFWVALINYFDRQSLAVVAPFFQRELHLSDAGYSHVVTAFLFASAISYALAGLISDRLGSRLSMALFVGGWSIAEALTSLVHTTWMLGLIRFMLGLGEPGLWVAAPKVVGEFFEKGKRSLAIGFYTLGATVGAVVALPVIVAVTTHLPWRTIFLLDGLAGLLWLPLWFLCLHRHQVSMAERCAAASMNTLKRAKTVLSERRSWQLLVGRALTDPVWYFYLFWFPKFLASAHHLTMQQVAQTGWLVYLAAGVGTILGGMIASLWIKYGCAVAIAHRRVMIFSAILVPLSPLAGLNSSPVLSMVIGAIVAMAHMSWLVNLTSLVVELFPPALVASAAGLIAAGSAVGGMVFSEVIGFVVTHYGYFPLFGVMACLHPLALAILWSSAKRLPQPAAAPMLAG